MTEVILREDVRFLGKAGELVKVKPGYARNYLLPQGLAYEATAGNKKRIDAETKARSVRLMAEKEGAEAQAAGINALELTLEGKAGEGDRLFGSITAQDLAKALAEKGVEVDRRKIELDHPIKTLGEHTVTIRLHPEVGADLKVKVVPA
jgi:large subunit ribosomal protein L9